MAIKETKCITLWLFTLCTYSKEEDEEEGKQNDLIQQIISLLIEFTLL